MAKAKKKPARKKKAAKKKVEEPSIFAQIGKIVTGVVILAAFVIVGGFLANHFLKPEKQVVKKPVVVKRPVKKPHVVEKPTFEIYPDVDTPPKKGDTKPVKKPVKPSGSKLPKVALIIDDMGYDKRMADKLLSLNAVMTFSILPYSPKQTTIARAAHNKGMEIMLHLPMEPMEYPKVNPGPGALLTTMSPDQLIRQLKHALDDVPYIIGVNNHMGSKMTTRSTTMYQIFSILKRRDLFFIDSRTTADSMCKPSARLLRVRFSQRDVFLDHFQVEDAVKRQINLLIKRAEKNGQAVGIGHPYKVTYEVLRKELPKLRKRVELVPASSIVNVLG